MLVVTEGSQFPHTPLFRNRRNLMTVLFCTERNSLKIPEHKGTVQHTPNCFGAIDSSKNRMNKQLQRTAFDLVETGQK
jgi:hypothetical protein